MLSRDGPTVCSIRLSINTYSYRHKKPSTCMPYIYKHQHKWTSRYSNDTDRQYPLQLYNSPKAGSTNLRAPPYKVAINSPAKPGEFLKTIITNSGSIWKKNQHAQNVIRSSLFTVKWDNIKIRLISNVTSIQSDLAKGRIITTHLPWIILIASITRFLGPTRVCPQTASRSVYPLLRSSPMCPFLHTLQVAWSVCLWVSCA